MQAKQAAALFAEMAELMEIRGGDPYRARSFSRAARILEKLDEPLVDALRFGALARRRGIGEGTLARLSEMLRTGTCRDLQALRGDMPAGVRQLLSVDGIGPKTVRLLWTHLRIGSLEELERAARGGRLAALPRFGERQAERIVAALEGHRKKTRRTPLAEALAIAGGLIAALDELETVQRVELAGSARRRKETVGDLDILVASYEPLAVSSHFITLPAVDEVLSRGASKTSVRLSSGQQVDLRVLGPETFGAALCYFTGSQQHNIMLRARGNKRQLKISEHGIFTRATELRLAGAHEEEVFAAIGLPWIAPELRENAGELEAAEQRALPRLVERGDLRGDLHAHSDASDGRASAETLAHAAAARGLSYLALTEHSQTLGAARGLEGAALLARLRELRELEQRLGKIRLLAGVEVEILPDGSLDLPGAVLSELDWVVGALHGALDQPREVLMRRIVRALESGHLDALAHPTGRHLRDRPDGLDLDIDLLLHRARRHDVALEVNGAALRLDLPAELCRRAVRAGVALILSSDAHDVAELAQLELALMTARRGWVEARSVLNTLDVETLLAGRRARKGRHLSAVAERNDDGEATATATKEGDTTDKEGDTTDEETGNANLAALQQALLSPPFAATLRARLESWLRGEADAELTLALEYLSENPTRRAFELLWADDTGLVDDSPSKAAGDDP